MSGLLFLSYMNRTAWSFVKRRVTLFLTRIKSIYFIISHL